ncbi:NAD-dependent epimerase [Alphaproteobacteria bacterium]|nr:NAD-dependent epimerase [Alphaproteobacteria bacterium]
MSIALITGSGGLIGSTAVRFLQRQGLDVVGIDNNMRQEFFGEEASTNWCVKDLLATAPGYIHHATDIRDAAAIESLFASFGERISLILHTAAQPSHDWAAKSPMTDFSVNALGTLTLLEAQRKHCPEAVFIFTSTNKVYGDLVNALPFVETPTRYALRDDHPWAIHGVDESMSIDQSLHSLFGVSKASADLLVQEYGRYFGLSTGVFRGGCLTGSGHSAAQLHGFLGYLMRSALTGTPYTIFGYKGKQVRDNIHANDLVAAFWHFFQNPQKGEVYNIGGGTHANISVLEAIEKCGEITGKKMQFSLSPAARSGDHQWWISDVRKFQNHYPTWRYAYDMDATLHELYAGMKGRYG